jgi:hypothetical protein
VPRSVQLGLLLIALVTGTSAQSTSPAPAHATDQAYNRALGVTCEHCHVTDKWTDASKSTFGTAKNMTRMVAALNEGALKDLGEISCWTCHGGQQRPSRQPREALDAALAKWPAELASAPESQKITMAVYSVALGVECDHCHAADWKSTEKPAMKTVERMNGMFKEFPKYMPSTARTQCWMCHKGSTRPRLRAARFGGP